MVFTRTGVVEMLDIAEPEPQDGELVIDVAIAGICGSELHGISQPGFRVPPLVMGHEFAGTTPDGRRVVVNPILSCGTCPTCSIGLPNVCESRRIVGVHLPGGFAERVAVPEASVRDVPADLTWGRAAVIEPLANAVHAWNLVPSSAERVGIIGAGAIGLACLLAGRTFVADRVIDVADTSPDRRRDAEQLGATRVGEALDGQYDAVIEAVGLPVTRAGSVTALRNGGTAVWLGLSSSDSGMDGAALVRGEKRVVGSFAYTPDEFDRAVDLAAGVDTSWTTVHPLEAGADVFMSLMATPSTAKALLVTKGYLDA